MQEQFEKLKLDFKRLKIKQLGKITRHIFEGWNYCGISDHGTVTLDILIEGVYARVNVRIDGIVVDLV